MNIRVLVPLSLLVAIGVVLHQMIPPIFNGMKPDMMLLMMFLGIMLFPQIKNVLILGIATGFLSGLTSSFPGGLVPNIIDKILTSLIIYGFYLFLTKLVKQSIATTVLTALGTIISGSVFLTSALLIVGLPGGVGFLPLFIGVVIPATFLNTISMMIIYPIVQSILKRTNFLSVSES